MSETLADPHWLSVAVAYAVTLLGLGALAFAVLRSLANWAKRARDAERG